MQPENERHSGNAATSYRKKPVEIEAVQFGYAEWADQPEWRNTKPDWLAGAEAAEVLRYRFYSEDYWYFEVHTLEGVMRGGPDDWLVRGVKGELYPVRHDIFEETYEPVT